MYRSLLKRMLGSRLGAALTVGLWLVVVSVLTVVAPDFKSVQDNSADSLPPAATESMRAHELMERAFPNQSGTPALIVVRGADSERTTEAVQRIGEALAGPGRPDGVTGVVSPTQVPDKVAAGLSSPDGGTQVLIASVVGNPSDESFRDSVGELRRIAAEQAGDTEVAVTGPAGIATDTTAVFTRGDKVLLFATVLLVLAILLAIYRSPLMALIPLLAVGVAMRVTELLGALMADADWFDISAQTASIMTVLLFGVGTDYTLIITARYREALRTAENRFAAMQQAMDRVGEILLSSASTVVLGMLALLVAVSPALRGFGPYFALGIAVMALVAFSFIPALVLLGGRAVFWPTGERKAAERSTGGAIWHRVADLVTRAPARVAVAVVAVLALLSLGLINYKDTYDFVSGFRVDTESAEGRELLREGLGPGEIAPTTVLVRADHVGMPHVAAISEAVRGVDGVTRVSGRPQISDDGTTAAIQVVLNADPYSPQAFELLDPVREAATDAAKAAGLADPDVVLAGETAKTADVRSAMNRDMIAIGVLLLAVIAVVLGLLLRSVLAPIYLVATLVLSFLATLGATTFFAINVLGDEGIGNRVGIYIFVFLTALGVDYNIFVMSRFRQELRGGASPREAIRLAVTRTGGVVSSAGVILAATFAVLTTMPLRELFQFGFGMALGILLDTFLIRPLLVPAIVTMLDRKALWPMRIRDNGRETAEQPA